MKITRVVSLILVAAGITAAVTSTPTQAQQPDTFRVYANNLQGPRGLRFGPDGFLYVAEAGTGGKTATSAKTCEQVPAPVGPYTGAKTARISKIAKDGTRTTVASGFPSTVDAMGDVIGVADLEFVNGNLYALISGGGCSHGNTDSPNGVALVNRNNGQWNLIANLDTFLQAHQAKFENPGDFEPDGVPYSLTSASGVLYAVEPNHGQIFSVTTGGAIRQAIDISASEGHIVPTSIAHRDTSFYVGNLNVFPVAPGSARVLSISQQFNGDFDLAPGFPDHRTGYHIIDSKPGFTAVVGIDFGPDGLLYALELTTAAGFPTPGTGKVVRVTHSGAIEDVVTGLTVPTGMTFGPDNRLYVSNLGAAPAGAGQVLQFDVPPGD